MSSATASSCWFPESSSVTRLPQSGSIFGGAKPVSLLSGYCANGSGTGPRALSARQYLDQSIEPVKQIRQPRLQAGKFPPGRDLVLVPNLGNDSGNHVRGCLRAGSCTDIADECGQHCRNV